MKALEDKIKGVSKREILNVDKILNDNTSITRKEITLIIKNQHHDITTRLTVECKKCNTTTSDIRILSPLQVNRREI